MLFISCVRNYGYRRRRGECWRHNFILLSASGGNDGGVTSHEKLRWWQIVSDGRYIFGTINWCLSDPFWIFPNNLNGPLDPPVLYYSWRKLAKPFLMPTFDAWLWLMNDYLWSNWNDCMLIMYIYTLVEMNYRCLMLTYIESIYCRW